MAGRSAKAGQIRIGIGGWNYAPWRGAFYPQGLAQAKELEYAASRLTSIEINSTFYGSQKPESFRKWASAVPDGFIFSVKGPRFATNRARPCRRPAIPSSGFSIPACWNCATGLGRCCGNSRPIKKFDAADFGKFLELLPAKADGKKLRHVVEVRHASFRTAEFVALARTFAHADRVHRSRDLSVVRRRDRRFYLCAPAKGKRHDPDRLPAERYKRMDRAAEIMGGGKTAA